MATERLAPDAIISPTNLSGAVSAVQDDPDSADANWLTSPALQSAAAKNFYLKGGTALDGFQPMQDGGTAPADAAFATATGWVVGAVGAGNYSRLVTNTERGSGTFATTPAHPDSLVTGANANAFRIPMALTGSFSAGNWTISAIMRSVTAAMAAGQTGRLRWRIYKGAAADGSNAVELTGGVLVSNTVAGTGNTTANHAARTITFAMPAITMNNEYLFFACAYEIVATSGSGSTRDINFRENTDSKITTAVFTPKEPNDGLDMSFPTPSQSLTSGAGLQEIRVRARKKGSGPDPTMTITVLQSGLIAQTDVNISSSDPGAVVNLLWNSQTVINAGDVTVYLNLVNTAGASIEVGAVEWNATTTDPIITKQSQAIIQSSSSVVLQAILKKQSQILVSDSSTVLLAPIIGKLSQAQVSDDSALTLMSVLRKVAAVTVEDGSTVEITSTIMYLLSQARIESGLSIALGPILGRLSGATITGEGTVIVSPVGVKMAAPTVESDSTIDPHPVLAKLSQVDVQYSSAVIIIVPGAGPEIKESRATVLTGGSIEGYPILVKIGRATILDQGLITVNPVLAKGTRVTVVTGGIIRIGIIEESTRSFVVISFLNPRFMATTKGEEMIQVLTVVGGSTQEYNVLTEAKSSLEIVSDVDTLLNIISKVSNKYIIHADIDS